MSNNFATLDAAALEQIMDGLDRIEQFLPPFHVAVFSAADTFNGSPLYEFDIVSQITGLETFITITDADSDDIVRASVEEAVEELELARRALTILDELNLIAPDGFVVALHDVVDNDEIVYAIADTNNATVEEVTFDLSGDRWDDAANIARTFYLIGDEDEELPLAA